MSRYGIRAHLVQFVLSVLAVALGVAFVAGTFSLRTMMSSTFTGIIQSSIIGDAYVRGSEPLAELAADGTTLNAARNTIPVSLATSIEHIDGVKHAFASFSGPIVLVGADGTAVSSGRSPTFGIAMDPKDSTVKIVTGRAPNGPGEIGLDSGALKSSGLAVGAHTKVVHGRRDQHYAEDQEHEREQLEQGGTNGDEDPSHHQGYHDARGQDFLLEVRTFCW